MTTPRSTYLAPLLMAFAACIADDPVASHPETPAWVSGTTALAASRAAGVDDVCSRLLDNNTGNTAPKHFRAEITGVYDRTIVVRNDLEAPNGSMSGSRIRSDNDGWVHVCSNDLLNEHGARVHAHHGARLWANTATHVRYTDVGDEWANEWKRLAPDQTFLVFAKQRRQDFEDYGLVATLETGPCVPVSRTVGTVTKSLATEVDPDNEFKCRIKPLPDIPEVPPEEVVMDHWVTVEEAKELVAPTGADWLGATTKELDGVTYALLYTFRGEHMGFDEQQRPNYKKIANPISGCPPGTTEHTFADGEGRDRYLYGFYMYGASAHHCVTYER